MQPQNKGYLLRAKIFQFKGCKMIKFERIEEDPRNFFKDLKDMLVDDKDVAVVYLFGSYAKDNVTPLSDIDIAILLDSRVRPADYFDKQLDLLDKISQKLHTDEVDVVILNQAPSLLAYQVIKIRKVLFCRNEPRRISFEANAIDRYLDEKPMRSLIYQALADRIKGGRFAS
jgi:predicted nucleotidyltransferase